MSFTTRTVTRTVTADLEALECDGPECRVFVAFSPAFGRRVPDGWLVLSYLNETHTNDNVPDEGYAKEGQWHFHSPRCLALWLRANDIPDWFSETAQEVTHE